MENNPLRQYFRRPSVYITLPSKGEGYTPEQLNMTETGELPVYPMTAIDEITARTPDALFNGSAIAELVKSCVPNIKDPWAINSNDLDAVLLAMRAASNGDKLDIETKCPSCDEVANFEVNLIGILASLKPADYNNIMEVGELKIRFKPLMWRDMNAAAMSQLEVQRTLLNISTFDDPAERDKQSHIAYEKITKLTMNLLAKTIDFIETPNGKVTEEKFILDFLEHCDKKIYNSVRDFNTELREPTQIKPIEIKCPSCEHEYKQELTLNPTDFFG